MIQVSGISNEHVSAVTKVEPPKLARIESLIRDEKVMEFKRYPDPEEKAFTKEEVEKAVDSTNKILKEEHNAKYQFEIHEGTGRVMVNLVDMQTKEVLKEIPPEKILDLVANIWERLGLLVDERG
ncbi:flagellar protein FlaG [Proteiniclasticum ruminis]|uniref:FlaG protein n=1 Tax=Proteiniclasticum ruminis TaxID=398199 RepID=A0A1I5CB68_9CLOT|nr:flagellar protein FlaG [Proteiniclasticum ruminis]SFN83881.1 FlaG protein [Proteiniclasticum ruminis]